MIKATTFVTSIILLGTVSSLLLGFPFIGPIVDTLNNPLGFALILVFMTLLSLENAEKN